MSCSRSHVYSEHTEKQSKDFMQGSDSESRSHLCFWGALWLQRGERFEENYYWRMRVYLEDFHCHSAKRCGCLKINTVQSCHVFNGVQWYAWSDRVRGGNWRKSQTQRNGTFWKKRVSISLFIWLYNVSVAACGNVWAQELQCMTLQHVGSLFLNQWSNLSPVDSCSLDHQRSLEK